MTFAPGDLVAVGSRASVHACGRGAVVKVPFDSTPEGWIDHEARHARWARSAGAPAPRLLGVEIVHGRSASVWERVRGPTLWQAVLDGAQPPVAAGRLLAEVHRELLGTCAPVQLPRQVDRLTAKVRTAAALVRQDLSETLALAATASGGALCHGDLHPGNVLLGPDGPVVIDWFDAGRGDGLADVARSWLTISPAGGQRHRHLPGADPAALATCATAHATAMGVDPDDLLGRFAAWVAVQAAARVSEGVGAEALLRVWSSRRGAVTRQPT